jgi:catechol 2,3-dioxygenase-like lactoylglutathione lyase family enzyme
MDACRSAARAGWRRARHVRLIHAEVLGRFHEIGITTDDIRASVEFYERLGFTQAETNDTWTHPYGVLTDGRIHIGLHQHRFPSPSLTFVHADVASHVSELEAHGIELSMRRTTDDVFNEVGFLDPSGQMITVLEARTYSPVAREEGSLCGYFTEYSIPAADFEAAQKFWEPLGFVATEEPDAPYAHLPLTSDHLDIAFHKPKTYDAPLLVFRDPGMKSRITKLRDLGVIGAAELPRGLNAASNALILAPEGTALLLLEGAL